MDAFRIKLTRNDEVVLEEDLEGIDDVIMVVDAIRRVLRYGPSPAIAVDGLCVYDGRLLLIERGRPPFQGLHALPGGFVRYGETAESAVVREVLEETGLRTEVIDLLGVFSAPDRDPRWHVISIAYVLRWIDGELRPGDDAIGVYFVHLDEIPDLAFDHAIIVQTYKKRYGL